MMLFLEKSYYLLCFKRIKKKDCMDFKKKLRQYKIDINLIIIAVFFSNSCPHRQLTEELKE